jgi:hypothetical protein
MQVPGFFKHVVAMTLCATTIGFGATAYATDEAPASDAPAAASDAAATPATVEHPRISTHFPHGRRIPHTSEAILTERVRLLTAELDLTEPQQTQLRVILVRQADAIRRVWTDRSLTDGERGPITSAIGEKTADAIRDLLSPAQREKYNPPRPNTNRPQPEQAKDLTKWLDAFQQK